MSWIGVDFGHLTCGASFDIFCYKGFHIGPPVVGRKKLECFGNSGVADGSVVVKKGCYSPLKFVVSHDNQCGPVVPVGSIK